MSNMLSAKKCQIYFKEKIQIHLYKKRYQIHLNKKMSNTLEANICYKTVLLPGYL